MALGVVLSVKKKSEKQIHELLTQLKESGDDMDRLKSQLEAQRVSASFDISLLHVLY